jgi:YD repeat-containing protein
MAQALDVNGSSLNDEGPTTYTYDGDGNVETITLTNGPKTWVRSYTYNEAGAVLTDSGWVPQ